MFVNTADGRKEYVAALTCAVKLEMEKFYHDLNLLIKIDLTIQEILYFVSLLYLVFVKINPFEDSNCRAARLI